MSRIQYQGKTLTINGISLIKNTIIEQFEDVQINLKSIANFSPTNGFTFQATLSLKRFSDDTIVFNTTFSIFSIDFFTGSTNLIGLDTTIYSGLSTEEELYIEVTNSPATIIIENFNLIDVIDDTTIVSYIYGNPTSTQYATKTGSYGEVLGFKTPKFSNNKLNPSYVSNSDTDIVVELNFNVTA